MLSRPEPDYITYFYTLLKEKNQVMRYIQLQLSQY